MPPPEKKELRRAFEQLLNRLSERDQILIRQMAPGIPTSAEGWEETYGQLRFRLWGVHHEFGHFLHHSGLDEAILPGEAPLLIRNMSRQDRLISEIWAFLQEQPWRVQNMDVGSWIIAGRLGENFPLYIRNLNDQWYFEATNERLMRELFPLP